MRIRRTRGNVAGIWLRRALAFAVLVVIVRMAYCSTRPLPLPGVQFGPNANRFNCDTLETDRPLSDLDSVTRARVLELLQKACKEGETR